MTNDAFGEAVVASVRHILYSEADLTRLNLARDIVNGWRKYLEQQTLAEMIALVRKAASDNKIAIGDYEAKGAPQTAAEMILYAVDGFYRKSLTRMN